MAQLPNVKLKVHPSTFDLMMAVLERNAAAEDVPTRNSAQDLMDKRMRFSRRFCGVGGKPYVSMRMYESEASEMIWQLLYACAGFYQPDREYSTELKKGGGGDAP